MDIAFVSSKVVTRVLHDVYQLVFRRRVLAGWGAQSLESAGNVMPDA
jgi:hypothetical protein